MRRFALLLALGLAPALRAQVPEPGPGPGPIPDRGGRRAGPPPFGSGPAFGRAMRAPDGPPGDIGFFLLAHTAELKLRAALGVLTPDQQATAWELRRGP